MVSQVRPSAPQAPKPSKPLLRRATLSGTVRKVDDAGLDTDLMSAPHSPSKKVRVTFNPNVEEKVMEEYGVKGRSLESVRAETRRAIEAHGRGDSDEYDRRKEIMFYL